MPAEEYPATQEIHEAPFINSHPPPKLQKGLPDYRHERYVI